MQKPVPLLLANRRQLVVAACILVPTAVALLFPRAFADWLRVESWAVGVGGVTILVAVMIWLSREVRCRNCGANLFLHAIGHTKGGNWLHWLLHTESCPKCGHTAKVKLQEAAGRTRGS